MGSALPPTIQGNEDGTHDEAQGHGTALPAAGSEVTVISPGCKTLPRPTQAFQAACFLPHPAASMTLDIKH